MEINISIDRDAVLTTITHSAAYTGSKFVGDESAYERINTREVDRDKLLQLWDESAADIAEKFHGLLQSQGMENSDWVIILEIPSNFEQASLDGVTKNLTSFFSNSVLSKWFVYTNKAEAGAYSDHAQTFLSAAHTLIHERKRPTRPTIVDPEDVD